MSHIATGIVQRRKAGGSSNKSVLMFMAACASDDGTGIWTSKGNIAADLEMSKRTVQRVIEALISAGLISEIGQRKCRNGFTVEYRINLEAIEKLPSTRDTMSPVDTISRGDTMSPVTPCHLTGDTMTPHGVTPCHPNHPRTIHEPSVTPSAPQTQDLVDGEIEPCPDSGHGGTESGGNEDVNDDARVSDLDAENPKGVIDRFLDVFPRVIDEKKTRAAFLDLVNAGEDPAALLRAAELYAAEQAGNDMKFIKSSDRFLREGRWRNYQIAEAASARQSATLRARADHWASSIENGRYVPTGHITGALRDEIIRAGHFTDQELRERGHP